MFQAPIRKTQARGAIGMLELIYFSIVREMRKTHRHAMMGLFLNMMQTFLFVIAFYVMFEILGLRGSAVRGDFLLYLMSGIFIYLTHIKAMTAVVSSEGPASAVMQHAPMNTAIAISSAALASLYIQILSMVIILAIYHIGITPITIDKPIGALWMVIVAWFCGVGVGTILLALKPWMPDMVNLIRSIYARVNMLASGKMFLANTLPAAMLPFFDWNPLFHTIDQSRGYIFLHYNPHFSSSTYPVYVGLVLLMLGLMGEFYTRKNASASWDAAR